MSAGARSVGIVVGADTVPRWQQLAIEDVQSAGVEVSVFRAAAGPGGPRSGGLLGLVERWDRRRFGSRGDLLDTTDASPAPTALGDAPPVDLLLWLSDAPLPARLAARLPLGLWYLRQGQARSASEGPLLREVRSGRGLVHTELWSFDGARHRLLLRSVGTADTLSLHRARLRAYAKAARLPGRLLRAPAGAPDSGSPAASPPPAPARARLGLAMAARVLARVAGRRLRAALFEERWVIGWRPREPGAALDGVRRYTVLEPPAGHYYADPFALERDGVAALLFEDYPSATGKGVIAAARLAPGAAAPRTVVELEGHTSYPFLLEEGEEVFMVPESRQAGRIELWRAESFPERWAPVRALIDDLAAADATLLRHDGRLWLFAAVAADEGAPIDELHLFHAVGLDQPWEAHPLNPVVSDVRRARPAGPIFSHEGALVRPAQDCSRAYGWRTVLNRIDALSTTDYRESPLAVVRPAGPLVTRTHTFSVQGGLEAVDALRLVPRLGPLRRRPPATVALRVIPSPGVA